MKFIIFIQIIIGVKVNGKHEFNVSATSLWAYLMDPVVLAKITPGISALELIEEDSYKTVSAIKIGPVKGSFKGNLVVVDKEEPMSFSIQLEQLSKIGNAHGVVKMSIEEVSNNLSALGFDGNINLSGIIARTGQRVLSGVANAITKMVFEALEKHILEDESNKNSITT